MIDEIVQKITEEKNNLIAQAFTMQIGSLLISNGIVPIMKEYTQNDVKTIMDSNRYEMVMEFGVAFDELDTTEHDKQIRKQVIKEIEDAMYHQCFECDNDEDMQKWDGGNWIRYKLFERVMEQLKEQNNGKSNDM